jgi:signal transduction histidine kinase
VIAAAGGGSTRASSMAEDQTEVNKLRARNKKLATEKSYLQLVVDMMCRLSTASGLENTLHNMIYAVVESIGGANAAIYYKVDDDIYRMNLTGSVEKIDQITDSIVADVFRDRKPIEIEHAYGDTKMLLPEFCNAQTLAYPLIASGNIIGVFKIDSMHIGTRNMQKMLPIFFEFAALILNNEIFSYNKIKKSYDELNKSLLELIDTKNKLEIQIAERTEAVNKLTLANLELGMRTAELEQANRELESFSYSVSHDLRTPLRAIDGFSRLLLEDYGAQFDEEGLRFLTLVRQNVERMAQLIDDLLAFARASRQEAAMEQVDMAALAEAVGKDLRSAAPAGRKIAMRIGALPLARADKAMMRQVFTNLLGNALKFTGTRAEARIDVGGVSEGKENLYWVKDNGVGFDMRYLGKLFGVFQRLHSMEEFEGTGIGLAIVKRIVERHSGRIWAEGRVGEGATIYFALPC